MNREALPKRILITGGAGFIGSALVRFLISNTDHNVCVFDKLTYAGNLNSLKSVEASERYRFIWADICNSGAVRDVFDEFQPDILIHLAAESHVDRSIDGPATFLSTNVGGTFTLLQESLRYWQQGSRRNSFRFHHVSTDEVFGALGREGSFSEESPYRPTSPYAATKAASDHLVRAWHHTYNLPTVVSNCSNNYGPYQAPEKLIPTIILSCLEDRPIPVYGDGLNVRDWLHVDDHVRAIALIAQDGQVGSSYNVGAHCERHNIDVVRMICETVDRIQNRSVQQGCARLITFVPDRPGHDFRYAINAESIKTELGWSARTGFEKGLEATVQWYIENRDWWLPLRTRGQSRERLGLGTQERSK